MKYLIKPKGNTLKVARKNYGEIYYDNYGHLKLNLITGYSDTHNEFLDKLFIHLVTLLQNHFRLMEPVLRRGSSKGLSSRKKEEVSENELFDYLLKQYPDLKSTIMLERIRKTKITRNWEMNHRKECLDCTNIISYISFRCRSCAAKHRKKKKVI